MLLTAKRNVDPSVVFGRYLVEASHWVGTRGRRSREGIAPPLVACVPSSTDPGCGTSQLAMATPGISDARGLLQSPLAWVQQLRRCRYRLPTAQVPPVPPGISRSRRAASQPRCPEVPAPEPAAVWVAMCQSRPTAIPKLRLGPLWKRAWIPALAPESEVHRVTRGLWIRGLWIRPRLLAQQPRRHPVRRYRRRRSTQPRRICCPRPRLSSRTGQYLPR